MLVYSKVKDKIYYLILKRKLHWKGWEFPKGGIRKKEKILDAIKREIKEETGLKPLRTINLHYSGKYKYNKELRDRPGILGQEFKLYAVEVKKRKADISKNKDKEHSSYKWVGHKEALKKLTWPNQRQCLRIFNKFLKDNLLKK